MTWQEEAVAIWKTFIPIHERLKLKVVGFERYIANVQDEKCLEWLKAFNNREAKLVRFCYELLTPEQWKTYELLGVKDTREQNLLVEAEKQYKEKWLNSSVYKKEYPYKRTRTPKVRKDEHYDPFKRTDGGTEEDH
jgi:hypothetical protein